MFKVHRPAAGSGHADEGPSAPGYRHLKIALALLLASSVASGCGSDGHNGSATARARTTPTTWAVLFPDTRPATFEEIQKLIDSAAPSVPLAPVSAAAFDLGDPQPRAGAAEWRRLLDELCHDPQQLVRRALSAGRVVTVTAYVDSAGPQGPGTLNDHLDDDRAHATAGLISKECGVSISAFNPVGGDVAADDTRKVVVSFDRVP